MRNNICSKMTILWALTLVAFFGPFVFRSTVHAQDRIMGQIHFIPSATTPKISGVWIDGQYVGYLNELKGGSQLRLLPGAHQVVVRRGGYVDFSQKVTMEPGAVLDIPVNLEKDPRFTYPDRKTGAEVRFDVQPGRAAVFLDDIFVGNVDEYFSYGHEMLVAPGKHQFKIALPGFRTFETDVNLYPRQKMRIRTDLVEGSINDADPIIRSEPSRTSSAVNETAAPPAH
jgi:PEGA domain